MDTIKLQHLRRRPRSDLNARAQREIAHRQMYEQVDRACRVLINSAEMDRIIGLASGTIFATRRSDRARADQALQVTADAILDIIEIWKAASDAAGEIYNGGSS